MRQVTHALLTRPPLSHLSVRKLQGASLDLHVLSTPPAFILSQDQTLMFKVLIRFRFPLAFRFASANLIYPVYCCDLLPDRQVRSAASLSIRSFLKILQMEFSGIGIYYSVFKVLIHCGSNGEGGI